MFPDCPREPDVIDALTTGQWPGRCDDDLRAHVAECEGCRDLAAILPPLAQAWADTRSVAAVPASGMVWWRAQLRARQEAASAAARPIAVVQGIAGLAGVALALICLVALSPWLASFLASSRTLLVPDVPDIRAMQGGWLLAGGAATLLLTGCLAVYVVVAGE